MSADELRPFGEWDWTSRPSGLDMHSAKPSAKSHRITYRHRGQELERSFLLYTDDETPFSDELVLRGIEAHSSCR